MIYLQKILMFFFIALVLSASHVLLGQWEPLRRAKFHFPIAHVFFFDENTGYMSTSYEMYYSIDGGNNWTQPFVRDSLWDILTGGFNDKPQPVNDNVWFLDTEGVLVKLGKDGTHAFQECRSLLADRYDNLDEFDFSGDSLLWISTDSDKLQVSRDQGQSWTELYQFDKFIRNFEFIDDKHGIAIIGGGRGADNTIVPSRIFSTEDGGAHWQEITSLNLTTFLENISVVNSKYVWLLDTKGTWHSTDFGKTWQLSSAFPDSGSFLDMYFVDENNGWICGAKGDVARTRDGGETWQMITKPSANKLNEIYFIDENKGWVVGDWGFVATTNDGGDSWEWLIETPGNILSAICFTDENHGWTIGPGVFLQTEDGGENWEFKYNFSGNDIEFADKLHGWLISNNEIWATKNAGESWEKQTEYNDKTVVDLKILDANTAWFMAHAENAATVFRTIDGGVNWDMMADLDYNFNEIDFVSPTHGWGVGDNGVILNTEDGGRTWTKQHEGDAIIWDGFTSVDFVDALYGWAVNLRAEVFLTTDGGVNWQKVDPGHRYATELMNVHFFNRREGWIAGSYGGLLHTTDGGLTWDDSNSEEFGENWFDIFFLDENLGWACGSYGAIDKYVGTINSVSTTDQVEKSAVQLNPPSPNPVKSKTQISYILPSEMTVQLNILDLRGRHVKKLFVGRQSAGLKLYVWDGKNESGNTVGSGVYFVKLVTNGRTATEKLSMIR